MMIIETIKKYVSRSKIITSIFMMFFLSSILHFWIRWVTHLYHNYSSASVFFEYESVTPSYNWYYEWEMVKLDSKVEWKKPLEVIREDTLYCMQRGKKVKQETQYRPANGTEYKRPWKSDWSWEMYVDVPPIADECQVCWTVIIYTNLGYKKTRWYCTEFFDVNLPWARI